MRIKHFTVLSFTAFLFLTGCSQSSASTASSGPTSPTATASVSVSVSTPAASAQAAVDPIVQSIVDANTLVTLLETHSCVTLSQIYMNNGSVCYISYFMSDGEVSSIQLWQDYEGYATDNWVLECTNHEVTIYLSAYSDSYFNVSQFSAVAISDNLPAVTTDEYNNYILSSRFLLDADTAAGYGAEEGDYIVTTGKFDRDTLQSLEGSTYIEHPDGTKDSIMLEYLLTYDSDIVYPAKTRELLDGSQNVVTLQISDGTVRKYDVPAEATVQFVIPDGESIYTDEACTEAYDTSNAITLTSDTKLYCK